MKSLKFSLCALLCAALFCLPTFAGSDAKSTEWLEKMAKVYVDMPFSMDYTGEMSMNQMGQSISIKLDGNMIAKTQKEQAATMSMQMAMPQQGNMDMKAKYVLDGTMMWTEMQMPQSMGGMVQVTKMSLAKLDEMKAQAGMPGMMGGGPMDPAEMVKGLQKQMDFVFKGIKDGKVTLEAKMTQEAAKNMGLANGQSTIEDMSMTVTLDEKNIFPAKMAVNMTSTDGQQVPFVFTFKNFKKMSSVDDALFTYTPPEGAMVIDGDQMNQGGGQGGHGHDHGDGDHGHKH